MHYRINREIENKARGKISVLSSSTFSHFIQTSIFGVSEVEKVLRAESDLSDFYKRSNSTKEQFRSS